MLADDEIITGNYWHKDLRQPRLWSPLLCVNKSSCDGRDPVYLEVRTPPKHDMGGN